MGESSPKLSLPSESNIHLQTGGGLNLTHASSHEDTAMNNNMEVEHLLESNTHRQSGGGLNPRRVVSSQEDTATNIMDVEQLPTSTHTTSGQGYSSSLPLRHEREGHLIDAELSDRRAGQGAADDEMQTRFNQHAQLLRRCAEDLFTLSNERIVKAVETLVQQIATIFPRTTRGLYIHERPIPKKADARLGNDGVFADSDDTGSTADGIMRMPGDIMEGKGITLARADGLTTLRPSFGSVVSSNQRRKLKQASRNDITAYARGSSMGVPFASSGGEGSPETESASDDGDDEEDEETGSDERKFRDKPWASNGERTLLHVRIILFFGLFSVSDTFL